MIDKVARYKVKLAFEEFTPLSEVNNWENAIDRDNQDTPVYQLYQDLIIPTAITNFQDVYNYFYQCASTMFSSEKTDVECQYIAMIFAVARANPHQVMRDQREIMINSIQKLFATPLPNVADKTAIMKFLIMALLDYADFDEENYRNGVIAHFLDLLEPYNES